jgi:hypothetical protein
LFCLLFLCVLGFNIETGAGMWEDVFALTAARPAPCAAEQPVLTAINNRINTRPPMDGVCRPEQH